MSADAFIDTNVFIYLFDETNEGKRRAGRQWSDVHQNGATPLWTYPDLVDG